MYTIFIVDKDKSFYRNLKLDLEPIRELRVVGFADNGQSAMPLIKESWPDILILDLILHYYDGLYILSNLREKHRTYTPIIYALSEYHSAVLLRTLEQLRVDLFSLKPIYSKAVAQNVKWLINQHQSQYYGQPSYKDCSEQYRKIRQIMHLLGMSKDLLSIKQTADAILLVSFAASPTTLTKAVYEPLGIKYGSTPGSIERNIRICKDKIREKDTALYRELFGDKKVTNTVFITTLACYVQNHVTDIQSLEE